MRLVKYWMKNDPNGKSLVVWSFGGEIELVVGVESDND